jgi:hypothetical protein
MANQKISTLPAATALAGSELLELVQAGVNTKSSIDFFKKATIVKHVVVVPVASGTLTDVVLPGDYDYIIDYDTTVGQIEIDGTVAQRDGQRVTYCCTGANQLVIGANLGTAANQVRMNGSITLQQNDSFSEMYVGAISRWVQV